MGEAGSLSKRRFVFLDSARALAIIMVVCSHSLGYCLPFSDRNYDLIAFIVRMATTAVFFFSDGYLFAYKETRSKAFDYAAYIRQSLTRLIIPWFIFTTLYTLARYLFELSSLPGDRLMLGKTPMEVLVSSYGAVYASQMYFLCSLFIIRLAAPIYRWILGLKPSRVLLCFVLYHLVAHQAGISLAPYLSIKGGFEPILYAIWGYKYFLAGMAVQRLGLIASKKAFHATAAFFALALLSKQLIPANALFPLLRFALVQYSYILTIFFVFYHLIEGGAFLGLVGKHTMGIYLLHCPIILRGTAMLVNRVVTNPALSFALIAFIVFTLGLSASIAVNRIPYGSVLFGIPYRRKAAEGEPAQSEAA